MKHAFVLLFLAIGCVGLFVDGKKDEFKNGPLLDRLLRYRRQTGGVNYGFPMFPDLTKPAQFPNFPGHTGFGGAGGGGNVLPSRNGFFDAVADPSQFKGKEGWVTKSCVYDEKGKEKCVEQHGNKPKH